MADLDCDAVIIGSGPGGSTVADVLTAAGWSVIVLEKGRNHLISLEPPFDPSRRVRHASSSMGPSGIHFSKLGSPPHRPENGPPAWMRGGSNVNAPRNVSM